MNMLTELIAQNNKQRILKTLLCKHLQGDSCGPVSVFSIQDKDGVRKIACRKCIDSLINEKE